MKTQLGSLVQLTVVDVAFGGKGVARHEGKVYFVPFVIPGEVITARVVRQKKNFAEAVLVSVDEPAPERVEAPCPYFGRCGGCAYQHLSYARQLEIKSGQVEQTLRRVGRFEQVPMEAIVPSPKEYAYRNRIRVHVEGNVAGFYAMGSHSLIDIEQCPISRPEVNESLRRLRSASLPDGDYALRAPGGGGPFFEQTNEAVAREMVALVAGKVRRGQQLLVDAYCGSGLFAKQLAPLFEKVIGIEENVHAIESARRNALAHEQYVSGDVGAHLGDILVSHEMSRTTVLLDPPATGVPGPILDFLLGSRPIEIVYVSCDPATLARDLAHLARTYRLDSVTPLDMFPQTAEIEVVAHLSLPA